MIKLTNSTSFPPPFGWNEITNTSAFNPIKASVKAWEMSGGNGIAWDFATVGIILLIPTLIYVKSQNYIAAAFGQLFITLFMQHYGLVSPYVYGPSYVMIILMIALPTGFKWLAKRGG